MCILKWISLVIHYSNLPFTGDDVGRNWRRELRGWEKGKEGLKSGGKNTPEAESNRYASLHLQDLKSWLPTMSNSPMRYSDSLPLLILSCISLIYIHSPTNRITSHHTDSTFYSIISTQIPNWQIHYNSSFFHHSCRELIAFLPATSLASSSKNISNLSANPYDSAY